MRRRVGRKRVCAGSAQAVLQGGRHLVQPHQQSEQPFWSKTVPEASKGQVTANIQALSELGLKGTEIVRMVKLGLFDFAHGVAI